MPETVTPLRRLAFKLTRADHEAILKRFDDRPVSLSLIFACAIVVGFAWGSLDPGWFGELALLPVIALAAVILYGLVHLWRSLRRSWRVKRWTPPVDQTEIVEYADRLAVRENGRTRDFTWGDILAISHDDARVTIAKSRTDFIVAPLEAFADAADMRAFVLACKERMHESPAPETALAQEAHRPAAAPVARFDDSATLPVAATVAREGVDVALSEMDAVEIESTLRKAGADAPVPLSIAALTMGIAGAAIFGGPVWLVATGSPETRLLAGTVAALLGALLLTFLGARRIESARGARWPADDPRRMPRRFEIDEAGFVTRGAEFETRIAWVGVESIRETELHILFITRWKEVYAVPKRCFSNADAGRAFEMRARAYKTAS